MCPIDPVAFCSFYCFLLILEFLLYLFVFHDSGTLNIKIFSVHLYKILYVTQPGILRCMSYHQVFSNVCHTAQYSPMYVTPPNFSDVCHTAQNSPMYVTPPNFTDVCHTAQNSPLYVTPLEFN